MLIPSIDLMEGKIVQLVQGERRALQFDNFDYWIDRFSGYPLVQLIDLDAALGKGDNRSLLRQFTSCLACQVGGGIRGVTAAEEALAAGAKKIIIGSALFKDGVLNLGFAEAIARTVGRERIIAAVDSRAGKVAIQGWRRLTDMTPAQSMRALQPFCGGFLYTHIDSEGLMRGIPLDVVRPLRSLTSGALAVAGGICSRQQIAALDDIGVDAVVGMAIYTGALDLDQGAHSKTSPG